jgi:hypothetical protein
MCNAWNHVDGCTCGFGGEGHLGGGGWSGAVAVATPSSRETAWHQWSVGHARCDLGERLTHPTNCPMCGALIYFHTNGNGDAVFFDHLGWPWPKHPCLSSDASVRTAYQTSADHLRGIIEMDRRPASITPPVREAVIEFSPRRIGKEVVGVVLSARRRGVSTMRRGRLLRLLEITLFSARGKGVIRLYLPERARVQVGDIVAAVPQARRIENGRILYVESPRIIIPP